MFWSQTGVRAIVWLLAGVTVLAALLLIAAPVSGAETAPVEDFQAARGAALERTEKDFRGVLQMLFDGLGTLLVILSVALTVAAFLDKRKYR